MTNGNYTTGIMAGYTIGQETEKSRQRRLSKMGEDQLLLHVKADQDKVAKTIADLYYDWEAKNSQVHRKHTFPINGWSFLGAFFIIGIILFFVFTFDSFNTPWFKIITITTALSLFIGYLTFDSKIDYINLSKIKDYTTVMIEKYDSDGYRNINEDEILRIVEDLEDLYKKENEVKKSINK